jgi:hypothetical protein
MSVRPARSQAAVKREAAQSWEAYQALVLTANATTALFDNPFFAALLDTAYARFETRFEVL